MIRKWWVAGLLAICVSTSAFGVELDTKALEGEHWYGLYMTGQKVGYLTGSLTVNDDGTTEVVEDAAFKLNMVGMKQDMRIYTKRTYGVDGRLEALESDVQDMTGRNRFEGVVEGDVLILESNVGGQRLRKSYPRPEESLEDSLKMQELLATDPEPGTSINFSIFEPMFQQEITGTATVMGKEERMFEGVTTEVYRVRTKLSLMGLESDAWVLRDGTTLEDRIAGIITMRLEPKEIAKDIGYANDTIVANAALVDKPVRSPRTRERLDLVVKGPLGSEHLFDDGRQQFKATSAEETFQFTGLLREIDAKKTPELPVTEESVQPWNQATMYVQSSDPKMLAKAAEIVDGETNSWRASEKLTRWVYANVRSTYSARLSNSLDVLENLQGDCTEHSMLFIGLARAVGLPAKEVAGLIYADLPKPGFYFHQWATVWVGEWVDVDPTFNQPVADATHIKLSEGDLTEQLKILPIIGQIQVELAD